MLRIQRTGIGQEIFALSGRMEEEHIAELESLIKSGGRGQRLVVDLKDLTLAGQEAISFLESCETSGIELLNCSRYVREWITRERSGKES